MFKTMKYNISRTWDPVLSHMVEQKGCQEKINVHVPRTRVLQFILLQDYSLTFNPFNCTVMLVKDVTHVLKCIVSLTPTPVTKPVSQYHTFLRNS